MNPARLEWNGGDGATTAIGYVNPNGQRCCGTLGMPGIDHEQYVYKVECLACGYTFGADGSDIHERKCPECQGGAAGPRWSPGHCLPQGARP
ncbi:MAG: hypothetical protein EYC70_06905 [Planctomycetota bacterium]|nr:MAG: hypothetical protein EYC70_06905 [Planctomycetota bacterium]